MLFFANFSHPTFFQQSQKCDHIYYMYGQAEDSLNLTFQNYFEICPRLSNVVNTHDLA